MFPVSAALLSEFLRSRVCFFLFSFCFVFLFVFIPGEGSGGGGRAARGIRP